MTAHVDIDVVLRATEQHVLETGRPARACRPYTDARELGLTITIVGHSGGGWPTVRLSGPRDAVETWLAAWGLAFEAQEPTLYNSDTAE